MDNTVLYHHGIVGMKWGIRRFQNRDGSLTTAGKKRRGQTDDGSEESKLFRKKASKVKVEEPKKKSPSEMTDAELREKIQRLELEQRYRNLTQAQAQTKSHEGKKFVSEVLKKSGENLAVQVVNHVGAKALNKVFGEKKMTKDEKTGEMVEEIVDVIFANNKKK